MNKIETTSEKVIDSGVRLKEYLNDAINLVSDEYIETTHKPDMIPKDEVLSIIQTHRNVLLCIKEICKQRKKF